PPLRPPWHGRAPPHSGPADRPRTATPPGGWAVRRTQTLRHVAALPAAATPRPAPVAAADRGSAHQLTEHRRQHSALAQILEIGLVAQPRDHAEARERAVPTDLDLELLPGAKTGLEASDGEPLLAGQTQRLAALSTREQSRQSLG